MRWLSHGWNVFTGLITLVIGLVIIWKFDTKFEKVVIDILVIIYIAIRSTNHVQGLIAMEQARLSRDRFLELSMGLGVTKYSKEEVSEAVATETKTLQKGTINVYIQGAFVFILFIATLVNLIYAL